MTQKEAEKATKYFGSGVSAGIWCYRDTGSWGIFIEKGDSMVQFIDGIDELRRVVNALSEALKHVQASSAESCWKDVPTDPFSNFGH